MTVKIVKHLLNLHKFLKKELNYFPRVNLLIRSSIDCFTSLVYSKLKTDQLFEIFKILELKDIFFSIAYNRQLSMNIKILGNSRTDVIANCKLPRNTAICKLFDINVSRIFKCYHCYILAIRTFLITNIITVGLKWKKLEKIMIFRSL